MASAGEWVRLTVAQAKAETLPTEAVWKSLEKHVGGGDKSLPRIQAVRDFIDGELAAGNDGPVMRSLWAAVTDYLERVQESMAAA